MPLTPTPHSRKFENNTTGRSMKCERSLFIAIGFAPYAVTDICVALCGINYSNGKYSTSPQVLRTCVSLSDRCEDISSLATRLVPWWPLELNERFSSFAPESHHLPASLVAKITPKSFLPVVK